MGIMVTVLNDLLRHREMCLLALQSPRTFGCMPGTQDRQLSRSSSDRYVLLPRKISRPTCLHIHQRTFQEDRHSCLACNPNGMCVLHTGCPSKRQRRLHRDNSLLRLLSQASPFGCLSCSQSQRRLVSTHGMRVVYNTQHLPHEALLYCRNFHLYNTHSVSDCFPTIFQYRGCHVESTHRTLTTFCEVAPYLLLSNQYSPYNSTSVNQFNSSNSLLSCTHMYVWRINIINNDNKEIVNSNSVVFRNTPKTTLEKDISIVHVFEIILDTFLLCHLLRTIFLTVLSATNTTTVIPNDMEEMVSVLFIYAIKKHTTKHYTVTPSVNILARIEFHLLPIGDMVEFLTDLRGLSYQTFFSKTFDDNVHLFPRKFYNFCNIFLSDIRHTLFCPQVVALVKVCVYSSYAHHYCNILQFIHKFTKRPKSTFVLVGNFKYSVSYILPIPFGANLGETIPVNYCNKRRSPSSFRIILSEFEKRTPLGFCKQIACRSKAASKEAHNTSRSRIIESGVFVSHFNGNVKRKRLVGETALNVISQTIQYNIIHFGSCHLMKFKLKFMRESYKKKKPSHLNRRILMQGQYDRRLSPISV